MGKLTVYGNVETSRTWWTAWMCAELGLDFENIPLDPSGRAIVPEDYLALNPHGRVPTLKDGEFTIWESMAINLYLSKAYGKHLYPDGLKGEAGVWQWSFWAVSRIEAPLLTLSIGSRNCDPGSEEGRYFLQHVARWDAEELARCREVLQDPLRFLDDRLATRRHILGERFTVADLNLACIFSRLRRGTGIDFLSRRHLTDWLRRCWSRQACPRREQLGKVLVPGAG